MDQAPLWVDTFEEALIDVLKGVYGRGWAQKAAADMFPTEHDPIAKGKWLEHALNPERAEKLGLSELRWILRKGREASIHTGMHFLAEDADYEIKPISREEKRAAIAERWDSLRAEVLAFAKMMEQA